MQFTYARGAKPCPPATAAAKVEASGMCRQFGPRKQRKIPLEGLVQLRVGNFALIEVGPFPAEIADHAVIDILHRASVLMANGCCDRHPVMAANQRWPLPLD